MNSSIAINLHRALRGFWRPARRVDRARAAIANGDFTEATALFAQARRDAPSWAEPCHGLAQCAAAAGDLLTAERYELEALALDPDHREAEAGLLAARAWRYRPVMEAWAALDAGEPARAKEYFLAALGELGSRIPETERAGLLAGIGWCHYALADFGWAADAFWAALQIEPASVDARRGLAFAWYRLGWFARAEEALAALVAERPDLSDAWSFHGWCAYALGRWNDALARFESACAADPTPADPIWGRAWSLYRLARPDEAVAEFERAFAAGVAHPSRFDVLEVARAYHAYRALLAPLSLALDSAGLAADSATCRAVAAELGLTAPSSPGGAASTGESPQELLTALDALARGDPTEAERILCALRPVDGERDWRRDWLRCRALERRGARDEARALALSGARRNPSQREWLEALARLDRPPEAHAPVPTAP